MFKIQLHSKCLSFKVLVCFSFVINVMYEYILVLKIQNYFLISSHSLPPRGKYSKQILFCAFIYTIVFYKSFLLMRQRLKTLVWLCYEMFFTCNRAVWYEVIYQTFQKHLRLWREWQSRGISIPVPWTYYVVAFFTEG